MNNNSEINNECDCEIIIRNLVLLLQYYSYRKCIYKKQIDSIKAKALE